MTTQAPVLGALMDGHQVAAYLGYNYRYLTEKISYKPGFPMPVRLFEGSPRRWLKTDIDVWLLAAVATRKSK